MRCHHSDNIVNRKVCLHIHQDPDEMHTTATQIKVKCGLRHIRCLSSSVVPFHFLFRVRIYNLQLIGACLTLHKLHTSSPHTPHVPQLPSSAKVQILKKGTSKASFIISNDINVRSVFFWFAFSLSRSLRLFRLNHLFPSASFVTQPYIHWPLHGRSFGVIFTQYRPWAMTETPKKG